MVASIVDRLVIPVDWPVEAIFAPPLNIRVHDNRLGGFSKPLVGISSLDLNTEANHRHRRHDSPESLLISDGGEGGGEGAGGEEGGGLFRGG